MAETYDQGYFDGASDALSEIAGEIGAALVIGYPDIQPNHYGTFHDYIIAITDRVVSELDSIYKKQASRMGVS